MTTHKYRAAWDVNNYPKPHHVLSTFLFLVFASICQSTFSQNTVVQKRVHRIALSIGNDAYRGMLWDKLRAPARDAVDVGNIFTEAGFSVSTQTNLNGRKLRNAIDDFIYDVETLKRNIRKRGVEDREAVVALFFYSGHGFAVDDSPYLPGTDADGTTLEDVIPKSYRLTQLVNALTPKDGDVDFLSVLLIDACRQTLVLPTKKIGAKSATFDIKGVFSDIGGYGRIAIFATTNGKASWDARPDHVENSVFTQAIKEAVADPASSRSFSQFISRVEERTPQVSEARWNVRQLTEVSKVGVLNDFYLRKADEIRSATNVSQSNAKGVEEPVTGYIVIGESLRKEGDINSTYEKLTVEAVTEKRDVPLTTAAITAGSRIKVLNNPVVTNNVPQRNVVCAPAPTLFNVANTRCFDLPLPSFELGVLPKGLEVIVVEAPTTQEGKIYVRVKFDRKARL